MLASAGPAIGARSRPAPARARQTKASRRAEAPGAFRRARSRLAVAIKRNGFRGRLDEADGYARMRGSTGHGHELRGRLERKDLPDRRAVEGQVKARADSALDHSPLGRADHVLAIRQEAFVAHRNIAEPWQDDVAVKSHRNVPSAVEMLGPFHLNVGLVPFGGASRRVYVD